MVSNFQGIRPQTSRFQATQRILSHPLLAYLALILLQLKLVWRIWDYKDLTTGDTSSYFLQAYSWFEHHTVNILWSPIYTAFFGSLLHLTTDVYAVMILHRLIIVFAASVLMLALMRQLLPHGLAWLISAWWVILPINFNTLYEVHLFSVLPLFVASLLVLASPSRWTRGGALAILLATAVLIRNEQLVSAIIFSLICIAWEVQQFTLAKEKPALRQYGLAYGIPLLLAGLVILFFVARSNIPVPSPALSAAAEAKHTLNICQVYAFGYGQRHPEWTLSPWTECGGLMEKTFGQPYPSLSEALWANPAAMLQHFGWNISLALNGIQVSLFNATSGSVNPDYAPVTVAKWVLIPTIAAVLILITGLVLLWRDRQYWWHTWLKQRALGWAVLGSVATVAAFIVIPMQRPRPSYLFSLAILLMACIGMSLFVILHRFFDRGSAWPQTRLLVPVIAVALLVAAPSYYPDHYADSGRSLLRFYNRFQPFQAIFERENTVFLTREFDTELCSYLGHSAQCRSLSYGHTDLFAGVKNMTALSNLLREQKVKLFYADELLLFQFRSNPELAEFLTNPESRKWKLLAMQNGDNAQWMLFRRFTKKEMQQSAGNST